MSERRNHAGEGERRKREALARLAARRETLFRRGRRALLNRLLVSGEATIDDVRAEVRLPPGVKPLVFGVVPGALADAGLIRAIGFAKTTRPEAHARPVQVWALADRAGALAWLRHNPDLPDDDAPRQRDLYDDLD
jgi:hypothetical protein